jgi:hypothetical protein
VQKFFDTLQSQGLPVGKTSVITVEGTADVGGPWSAFSRQVIEKPKGSERFFRVRMD